MQDLAVLLHVGYDQEVIDPDYDESSRGELADDFTEPEYEEAEQEYRPRKQK